MIFVTDSFIEQMKQGTDFVETVIITLADSTQITLGRDDLRFGDTIVSGSSSGTVPLGEAVCKAFTLHIDNSDGTYDNTNFLGASIVAKVSLYLEDMEYTEEITLGTFYVVEPQANGSTIEITAVDAMYKADRPFTVPQTLPISAANLYASACTQSGLQYSTLTFYNYDYMIQEVPENLTCRQVFGYIALIACGNAVIDNYGNVDLITYYFPDPEDYPDDWVYPVLEDWIQPPSIYTNDVTITGVKTVVTDSEGAETIYSYGTDDYVISFSNPLITGHEQDFVNDIYATMHGISFFPFSGSHTAYPIAEFMDPCIVIDRNGNAHYSFVTQTEFTFLGTTQIENTLPPPIMKNSVIPSEPAQVEQKAYTAIKDQINRVDTALDQINTVISTMNGMYITEEQQQGGGVVVYQHNKPTRAESNIIWMETADTRSVSIDGGQTWTAGITADGNAIVQHLAAEGISATWIDSGTLQVSDGNGHVIFYASVDNGQVKIGGSNGFTVLENKLYSGNKSAFNSASSGVYIGNDGIALGAYSSTYSSSPFQVSNDGALVARSGTIGGYTIGTYSLYATATIDGNSYTTGLRSPASGTYALAIGSPDSGTWTNAPFTVTHKGALKATGADIDGTITARSGTIGGFTIGTTVLSATATIDGSSYTTGLRSPSSGTYALAIGSPSSGTWTNAPFTVTHKGVLKATGAEINGSIRAVSSGRYTEVSGGNLRCGKVDTTGNDIQTGSLSPVAWGGDYANNEGVMLGATSNAKYLTLATSDGNGWGAALIINNGLNPSGFTQDVIFNKTAVFRTTATFDAGIDLTYNGETKTFIRRLNLSDGTDSYQYQGIFANNYGLVLGTYPNHDGTSGTQQVSYVLNNGGNHLGHTQKHIFYGSAYYNSAITVNGSFNCSGAVTLNNDTINFKNVPITQTSSSDVHAVKMDGRLLVGNISVIQGYKMRVDSAGTNAGSIYCEGSISCTSLTQRSDERLKNISDYDERYTEIIDELEPINFTWKDLKGDKEHVGLGARKTKSILDAAGLTNSGLVRVEEDIDEYSIDYSELTVMLLAKVQKQQKKIDDLESRLARLEAILEGLTS